MLFLYDGVILDPCPVNARLSTPTLKLESRYSYASIFAHDLVKKKKNIIFFSIIYQLGRCKLDTRIAVFDEKTFPLP